jgi:hypothetical protein
MMNKINLEKVVIQMKVDWRILMVTFAMIAFPLAGLAEEAAGSLPVAVVTQDEKIRFQREDLFADKVQIGGSFNDWNPGQTTLRKGPDGVWSIDVPLREGKYDWKWVIDGNWADGENNKLVVIRGKHGRLEVLPERPTFNTPYNSRIFFSGRLYTNAALRNVPDGERVDTGRTRFARMEYNLLPRMTFTAGDKVTGFMEADINQTEGRFQTQFSEGKAELAEDWGRILLFRRHRAMEFDNPLRSLDRFRDTLDDEIYFTQEERPPEHRFGRQFDRVRRNSEDNATGYEYSGWQGAGAEYERGRLKIQALGADHVTYDNDLWAARGTWTTSFFRFGLTYARHERPRGLISEPAWAGGDRREVTARTDTTGGYFLMPGTTDEHYSYDALVVLEPNGHNRDQWWGVDARLGRDTRHLFAEIQGRRKDWAFVAFENGDGLRPNNTANWYNSYSYLNPGAYHIGGRERDLTLFVGGRFNFTPRFGVEANYRFDDGTAIVLDRNRTLQNITPDAGTLQVKLKFGGEVVRVGTEILNRSTRNYPNTVIETNFDDHNFTGVNVTGAHDLLEFKQNLWLRLGRRWDLDLAWRFRSYDLIGSELESNELRGELGFDLSKRVRLATFGRVKSYDMPRDTLLTGQPGSSRTFWSGGLKGIYRFSQYINLKIGFGVDPWHDEDIEEGRLFFLRDGLARARRGTQNYGDPAITRALDQVMEAERILAKERRMEVSIDARF